MNDQIKRRADKARVRLVGRSSTDKPLYQAVLGSVERFDATGFGAYTKLMNALAGARSRL